MTGVGGQGIIRASDILAETALAAGYDVKKTDSLGMSQRGGSVTSHIRLSKEKVFSPIISPGSADYLVGFERLEALRCASFLKPNGVAIIDSTSLPPLSIIHGSYDYPSIANVQESLSTIIRRVYILPAIELATELGSPRAANVLHLGFLSVFLEIPERIWLDGIKNRLPPNLHRVNRRAFAAGVERALEQQEKGR